LNFDFTDDGVLTGATSAVANVDTFGDTITVSHSGQNFVGLNVGAPLYYNVTTGAGYFSTNPRGIVFLKTVDSLGVSTSKFQVSEIPDGSAIDIVASMSGTFQIADQARIFGGNNIETTSQTAITIVEETTLTFDGSNQRRNPITDVVQTNQSATVSSYSAGLITAASDSGSGDLDFYPGRMVLYTSTSAAASGLVNNTTYFIDTVFQQGVSANYSFTIKPFPDQPTITSISGGIGTQKFSAIGISLDKDIVHVRDNGFTVEDMIEYRYPSGGHFGTGSGQSKDYYFVERVYDAHNLILTQSYAQEFLAASGLSVQLTSIETAEADYQVAAFYGTGTGATFSVKKAGTIEYLVVGGGGGGGSDMGGGGGAGGYLAGSTEVLPGVTYTVAVGGGGGGAPAGIGQRRGFEGGPSSIVGTGTSIIAFGGGGGASNHDRSNNPAGGTNLGLQVGSGGGGSGGAGGASGGSGYGGGRWGDPTPGQGFRGGIGVGTWYPCGGGGSAGVGNSNPGSGGPGTFNNILGTGYYWAGGGSGSNYSVHGQNTGGLGGGGGGAHNNYDNRGVGGINAANQGGGGTVNAQVNTPGGSAGTNTGSGGGGGSHYNANNFGGAGGSGIVVVRFKV
jgi:hypothetical protein